MGAHLVDNFRLNAQRLERGRLLIAVEGAVDLFSAPELKRRLLEAVDLGTRDIVLDLSDTDFVDSTGLGALLTIHRRLETLDGRLIVVVPAEGSVRRLLAVTGVDSIFDLAASRREALARSIASDLTPPRP